MISYTINIELIEDFQMLKDIQELERLFTQAKCTVIQGGTVILKRKNSDGSYYTIDEISSESDLNIYRENVFKYLF